jgi:uncharacterized protein YciI
MSKLYAIIAHDKPDADAGRKAQLRAHLAHIETTLDRIAVAGPLSDENGHYTGSLLLVKADSEAKAREYLESDPYFAASIWSHIEIRCFSPAAGDWVGGKNW